MIPPFIQQIIGTLVRTIIVAVAAWFAGHTGINLTESQVGQVAIYLTPIIATVAWSLVAKYKGRLKFLTALASPNVLTEHQAEALAKAAAPSVLTSKSEVPVPRFPGNV